MSKYQSIDIANTNILKSTYSIWNNCSWSIPFQYKSSLMD